MTEPLHPSRLVLTAAIPEAEFRKKFLPEISNTPDLPVVAWGQVGKTAPTLLSTPTALPAADAVVITWAEAEWAALVQVFCGDGSPMSYAKRRQATWNGWQTYSDGAPGALGYWGYYRLVQVGAARVLLFKSNVHYAAALGEQNLQEITQRLIDNVRPTLILSVGTAGGARETDPVGTVNVVRAAALYESSEPQSRWPTYKSDWTADWSLAGSSDFAKLLFPTPTTEADIASIVAQFNQFYASNYPLSALNPGNLNFGAATPAINDLTQAQTALVTAKSFVVANTSGNLSSFACVEMDDAIIARNAAGKVAFGSIRNISDPVQNAALSNPFQGHWGEAIYTAYGLYTSFNGALTAWAVLAAQFAAADAGKAATGSAPAAALADADQALSDPADRAFARADLNRQRAMARRRRIARNDAEAHRLRGRARVLAATGGGPTKVLRIGITNAYCLSDYTAQVAIGSNGTPANVILDTGSSTLAVEPAAYSGSGDADFKPTTLLQRVTYGTGGWAGPVVDTTLTLGAAGDQLPLAGCPLALTSAQQQGNFRGVDGILGLAYNGMNEAYDFQTYLAQKSKSSTYPWPFGTVWTTTFSDQNAFDAFVQEAGAGTTYPSPYFDQLENSGVVANKFAFYTRRSFVSRARGKSTAAMLTDPLNQGFFILGGGEEQADLFTGAFSNVKVVHDLYYNTNLKSVRVDGRPPQTAAALQPQYRQAAVSNAIVDSGTSDLSLAQDVYEAVLQGLQQTNSAFIQAIQTAANTRNGIDAASLKLAQWPDIYFTLEGENGEDIELVCTPQTYWQTDFPAAGRAVFQVSGPLDPANQSILGLPLMNNYYVVFDRTQDVNGVIRFAAIKPLG